jgi:hypothetical protein
VVFLNVHSLGLFFLVLYGYSFAAYSLTVTDKMGGVLLKQANYTSGRGVDIIRLEKGVYFATIINNKNEKVTVAFSKL